MGLIENQPETKNIKFLRVSSGTTNGKLEAYLVEKVTKDTTNAVSRINKNNVEVWERIYRGGVSGTLKGIRVDIPKDAKFGRSIVIELQVDDMTVVITTAEASSFGRSLWKQIFHIDVTKKLHIMPFSFKPEDRVINGLTLKQDNIKLVRELPAGTPEVTGEEIRGSWVYDKKQQMNQEDFLEEKLKEWATSHNILSKQAERVVSEDTFLGSNVDTTELTQEERKQLVKAKPAKALHSDYRDKQSENADDFFDTGFNS